MKSGGHGDSRERILILLKTRGPQTAADLAGRMELTSMAVRQHLAKLAEARLVDFADEARPVGRPAQQWRLTDAGHARFPEGYMAEWSKRRDGSLRLVENHRPICAAATACTGLCDRELELFAAVLGDDVRVHRSEHLLDGARRCVYEITPR